MEIRHLNSEDITLIGQIDRSQIVDYAYRVEAGELVRYPVRWDVSSWFQDGTGEHSVHQQVESWRPVVEGDGLLCGAFDGDDLLGLSITVPEFEPGLTWLAFLHISRAHRGSGVGTALWNETEWVARESNSTSIYVSAVPSGPTIDFYLSQGCELAVAPHPELFAREPEDIHLIRYL